MKKGEGMKKNGLLLMCVLLGALPVALRAGLVGTVFNEESARLLEKKGWMPIARICGAWNRDFIAPDARARQSNRESGICYKQVFIMHADEIAIGLSDGRVVTAQLASEDFVDKALGCHASSENDFGSTILFNTGRQKHCVSASAIWVKLF